MESNLRLLAVREVVGAASPHLYVQTQKVGRNQAELQCQGPASSLLILCKLAKRLLQ